MKILFTAAIVALCALQVSGHTDKERLLHELMDDYKAAVDPGNIVLKMNVMLLCSRLDSETGLVVSSGWELYSWTDSRLTWSPEEYGGVSKLNIPSEMIWLPDMKLFNSLSWEVERDDDVHAVVMSDGSVIWVPRVVYTTACEREGNKFNCSLRVGSWSYDGNNVNLQMEGSEGIDLSFYNDACPLEVESHTAQVVSHTYPCCEEPYPSMDMSIVFKPRAGRQ